MKKLFFLNYFLFISFTNAFSQKDFIQKVNIYNIASCEQQAHLRLQIIYNSNYNNVKKPKIRWKRNEEFLNENNNLDILVYQLGIYSCEVSLGDTLFFSETFNLNDFNKKFILKPDPSILSNYPDDIIKNECTYAAEFKFAVLNAEKYKYYNEINFNTNDTLLKTYNWFINDVLQPEHSPKLEISENLEKANIRLNIVEGNCSFFSKNNIIYKNPNFQIKKSITSYEICKGDTAYIQNSGENAKHEWYKDGFLVYSSAQNNYTNLNHYYYKTNEPGKYITRAVYSTGFDDIKKEFIYSSTGCISQSDTINVIIKNSIKLDKIKYGILGFKYKLCDGPKLILNTNKI